MCSVWPTAAMLCCARLLVIHRCILSRWDAFGLSVSVSITAPWPWNTRAIWSGSGSVDMLTTTGCSGRRRPSPGMSRFPHMSQGVGSTKPQSAYGQQAGAVRGLICTCAEQSAAPDCLQPPLLRRARFRQQVKPGVRLLKLTGRYQRKLRSFTGNRQKNRRCCHVPQAHAVT